VTAADLSHAFARFAQWTANAAGTWQAFALALLSVIIWLLAGLYYGYADTLYQLVINTGTTIITFLMVFLIQGAQNRDTAAIKIQLAELIRATENAHNRLVSLEDLTEDQLRALAAQYAAIAHRESDDAH
jgi:low affinity Fe/Cu permease